MDLQIDRQSDQPIYAQVAGRLRRAIVTGAIGPGARLPATRALAQQLGVHRNTLVEAYRVLEREGLVRSSVGAGTFVMGGKPSVGGGVSEEPAGALFSWRSLVRSAAALADDPGRWSSARGLALPAHAIQLTGALADSRYFPLADFSACMREVLAENDPQILEYGPAEGCEPLRAWIAARLNHRGVKDLDAGRVFIVNGSQQGLDLLAKLFVTRDDLVVTEVPTYAAACVSLRVAGARLAGVPVDDEGLRTDILAQRLGAGAPRFLYMMPCYQNPTGVTLSSARRAELLRLARRHRLAIIEDHYDSDLHYWGEPPRPLLADDPDGQVILLGTFSKMLFPGLRLGWMVVPQELAEPLRRLRWATDLASSMLTQRAMERFCRLGLVDKHLSKLCRINGGRLSAMLEALAECFPAAARWTRPTGGLTLWCELPDAVDTVELFAEAARRGVLFSPGVGFYPDEGGRSALRLSFGRETEKRIRDGVRILGELVTERLRGAGRARRGWTGREPFL